MNYSDVFKSIIVFCGENEEAAKSLIDIVTISIDDSVNQLNTFDYDNDYLKIAELAHKLKTTFVLTGDKDLAQLAKIIEDSKEENYKDMDDLRKNVSDFRNKLVSLLNVLKSSN